MGDGNVQEFLNSPLSDFEFSKLRTALEAQNLKFGPCVLGGLTAVLMSREDCLPLGTELLLYLFTGLDTEKLVPGSKNTTDNRFVSPDIFREEYPELFTEEELDRIFHRKPGAKTRPKPLSFPEGMDELRAGIERYLEREPDQEAALRKMLETCWKLTDEIAYAKLVENMPRRLKEALAIDKETTGAAYDCRMGRNKVAHASAKDRASTTHGRALEYLARPKKLAEKFPHADPALCADASKELAKQLDRFNCPPLPLERLRQIPGFDQYDFEDSRFFEDYCKKERILYLCGISQVEEAVALRLGRDKTQGGVEPTALSSGPLRTLAPYKADTALSAGQLEELLSRCVVIPDISFWRYEPGRLCMSRDFVPLLKKYGRQVILPRQLGQELIHQHKACSPGKERDDLKSAVLQIKTMHRAGDLKYIPASAQAVRKAEPYLPGEDIIRIIQENPGRRFCVLSHKVSVCKRLAEEYGRNVIPVFMAFGEKFCIRHEVLPLIGGCINFSAPAPAAPETPVPSATENPTPAAPETPVPAVPSALETPAPVSAPDPVPAPESAPPQSRLPEAPDGCILDDGTRIQADLPQEGGVALTASGQRVCLTEKLAFGGEGDIFKTDIPGKAAKIYHENCLTVFRREKLRYMVGKNPQVSQLCWPEELLYDANGAFVGFLMKLAPENFLPFRKTVLFMGRPAVAAGIMKNWDRSSLAALCEALCSIFMNMHRRGVLMGDVNENNILLDPADNGFQKVMFVDCDSFQLGKFPCPVGREEYTAPGIYERLGTDKPRFGRFLRTIEDENYALATFFFRILMLDQLPYPLSNGSDDDRLERKRARSFPYYYRNKEGEMLADSSETPVGPYRYIWGNMPPDLKDAFAEVFLLGKDVELKRWQTLFGRYRKLVQDEKSSGEIAPRKYYDPQNDRYRSFTCICGEETNMPIRLFDNLRERNHPPLCDYCQAHWKELENTPCQAVCIHCGKEFTSNQYMETLRGTEYYRGMCPDCASKVQVKCSGCGDPYMVEKYRLKKWGRDRILCRACREKVKVRCSLCGKEIERTKGFLNQLEKKKQQPLCEDCLNSRKRR